MDAKEKAEKLVNKFKDFADDAYEDKQNPYYGQVLAKRIEVLNYSAKQCALIAVDEILEYIDSNHNGYYTMPESVKIKYDYYEKVKQELEKL